MTKTIELSEERLGDLEDQPPIWVKRAEPINHGATADSWILGGCCSVRWVLHYRSFTLLPGTFRGSRGELQRELTGIVRAVIRGAGVSHCRHCGKRRNPLLIKHCYMAPPEGGQ